MTDYILKNWKQAPAITATAYSYDHAMRVQVDARPWLASVTPDMIRQMDAIEWGGDQVADEIYRDADAAGCPEAVRLSNYLALVPRQTNGDTMGFEVHLDREEAEEWLAENRKDLFRPQGRSVAFGSFQDMLKSDEEFSNGIKGLGDRSDAFVVVEEIIRQNLSGPFFTEPELQKSHDRDIWDTATAITRIAGEPGARRRSEIEKVIRDNLSGPMFREPDIRQAHEEDIRVAVALIDASLGVKVMAPAPPAAAPVADPAMTSHAPTLSRKMVSQIARAFSSEGGPSYLQRLDAIARSIGYENQASMMSILKSAEERSPQATVPEMGDDKSRVIVAFGDQISGLVDGMEVIPQDHDGDLMERAFDTPEEASAYLMGVADMDGYVAYTVAAARGAGRYDEGDDFFRQREDQPDLDFRDWHNDRVRAENDMDDDPAP